MKKFITVKEMTENFPFSISQIYRMASNSTIPSYKVGGKIVFDPEEVFAWVKNSHKEDDIKDAIKKLT
jgi:excisionase family DNA binding protein